MAEPFNAPAPMRCACPPQSGCTEWCDRPSARHSLDHTVRTVYSFAIGGLCAIAWDLWPGIAIGSATIIASNFVASGWVAFKGRKS